MTSSKPPGPPVPDGVGPEGGVLLAVAEASESLAKGLDTIHGRLLQAEEGGRPRQAGYVVERKN